MMPLTLSRVSPDCASWSGKEKQRWCKVSRTRVYSFPQCSRVVSKKEIAFCFVNSIQNNPMRYKKGHPGTRTYRSGVDGEPGASLGGSSGSLEVDLFVRPRRGRERGSSVSARRWIGNPYGHHRQKIEDTRPLPSLNEISKSAALLESAQFLRKKETTTTTRCLRPRVLGRIESREQFRAR